MKKINSHLQHISLVSQVLVSRDLLLDLITQSDLENLNIRQLKYIHNTLDTLNTKLIKTYGLLPF